MADYKSTINLPETGFPMKADLANREPKMQAAWEQSDLYGKLRAIAKGRPRYVLHDGPPYANGAPHLNPEAYATKFTGRYEHRTLTGASATIYPRRLRRHLPKQSSMAVPTDLHSPPQP